MRFIIITLLITITACAPPKPEPSCTFIQNAYSQRVSWYYAPVELSIDYSIPIELRPAIYDAARAWSEAFGRELIRIVGSSYNVIYMSSAWDQSRPFEEANTRISWYDNTIYQANVYVNAANFQFYYETGYGIEFKSLMIHELGHVLGLDHSEGVMSPILPYDTVRWNIDEAILNNLKCEY